MAVFLSQNGADTSIRNHKGESPLDLASLYGRVDTVRLLLLKCPALVGRYIRVYQHLNVDKLSQCYFEIRELFPCGVLCQ